MEPSLAPLASARAISPAGPTLASADANAMEAQQQRTLAALYEAHVDFVHGVARQLGVSGADAEDLVQDTFVVAVRRFREFRGEAAVRTWLYSITAHLARNHRRGQRRRQRRLFAWREHIDTTAPVEPPPGSAHLDLARLLDRLDERSRALIVLIDLHGLPVAEVARTLGWNENTAYARLRRARKALTAAGAKERRNDG